MSKYKWVQVIKEYACGHKIQQSKHGYKYKNAEHPLVNIKANESCPSCYNKMLEE